MRRLSQIHAAPVSFKPIALFEKVRLPPPITTSTNMPDMTKTLGCIEILDEPEARFEHLIEVPYASAYRDKSNGVVEMQVIADVATLRADLESLFQSLQTEN